MSDARTSLPEIATDPPYAMFWVASVVVIAVAVAAVAAAGVTASGETTTTAAAARTAVEIRRSREEDHLSFTFTHNIVYWKDGNLLYGTWKNNQYRFDDDIYYNVSGDKTQFSQWSFKDWQSRGQDIHSAIANPLFLNPERGNFSLDAASPALKMGFKPIDVSMVGPRHK